VEKGETATFLIKASSERLFLMYHISRKISEGESAKQVYGRPLEWTET